MSDTDERRLEVLETVAGAVVEQITGMDMVGGARGLFREAPGREPVVPPDLQAGAGRCRRQCRVLRVWRQGRVLRGLDGRTEAALRAALRWVE